MEDALALVFDNINIKLVGVLILVVMEDALALCCRVCHSGRLTICLNPCCNGRCTRTAWCRYQRTKVALVLILVVMEDALAHRVEDPKALKAKS